MKFDKKINPQRISSGLWAGLIIANCTFCKWGVDFYVKDIKSQTATISLSPFKGDKVYIKSCLTDLKQSLPDFYRIKVITKDLFIIEFKDDIATMGHKYE